jgi:hypothetical protein
MTIEKPPVQAVEICGAAMLCHENIIPYLPFKSKKNPRKPTHEISGQFSSLLS